jgi:hypothetical protein
LSSLLAALTQRPLAPLSTAAAACSAGIPILLRALRCRSVPYPLSHSITAFIFLICQLQLPITTVDLLALATCVCHRFCLGSGPHGVGARRGPWQPTSLYRRFYRYHLPSFSCDCHFAVSIIPIAHFLVNLLFPVDVVAAKIEPKLANVLIR